MNAYTELKGIVESLGIPCSALTMLSRPAAYAVICMPLHQEEMAGDDRPQLFGAYLQVDLYATENADATATAIISATIDAGYTYRGRTDNFQNDRQHAEIRLMKLEGSNL